MNAGQSLTSHVADPENIIVINASLVDQKWLDLNTPFLAVNIIPNPSIPSYYVIDLSLMKPEDIVGWLSTNAEAYSYTDSLSYILLGHELTEPTFIAQIETAIDNDKALLLSGSEIVALAPDFTHGNYPNYYQVRLDDSMPGSVGYLSNYDNEELSFSLPFIKCIFDSLQVPVANRNLLKFYFTLITNSDDVQSIGIRVNYNILQKYYDYSGGKPNTELRSLAARLK